MTKTEQIDLSQYLGKETIARPVNPDWRRRYYKKVLWRRGAAVVLDYFLTMLPASIPAVIIWGSLGLDQNEEFIWVMLILQVFFFVLLCGLLESSEKQGTWGKRIMKIQVTDRDGYTISFFRSLWRNLFRIIVGYSYAFIIPLIIQVRRFRKTKKLFHDEWSGTTIGARVPPKAG